MTAEITPETLREWRKSKGLTQTELAEIMGLDKIVVSNIETGRRKISPPEQRLLRFVMLGIAPKGVSSPELKLSFDEDQWRAVEFMARREGYSCGQDWVVAKIKAYIAMLPEEDKQPKAVAQATDISEAQGSFKSKRRAGPPPKKTNGKTA